jgi:type IV pilus assembly protein PilY1
MKKTAIINFVAALAIPMFAAGPVNADDTELFLGQVDPVDGAQPNILFILDTSGSMGGEVVTKIPYNSELEYQAGCPDDRIYWREGPGDPPACDSDNWFSRGALECDSARLAFESSGVYTDRAAQYNSNTERWERIRSAEKDSVVECRGDRGIHGEDGSDRVYAQDGDRDNPWSDAQADEVSWSGSDTGRTYTLYDANYVNWWNDNVDTIGVDTRINIVKQVTNQLLDSLKGVNVGLMRFNFDQGGPVLQQIEDIEISRDDMKAQVDALLADGWTPLSETLYEAGQYYTGGSVVYGDVGPLFSVPASRNPADGTVYNQPISFECQKNYIVMLTDGEPTRDVDADARIEALPGYAQAVGPACSTGANGACLDDMAKYLFETDIDPGLPGQQNVSTYTIGFAINLPLLQETANKGGGEYYTANDAASLSTVLTNIVREILEDDTTFVSPTVSVNAFNRTQTLNDLFVAVFRPAAEEHWPGNIKKYKLIDGEIVGVDEASPVVDPATGFFKENAQSIWSANADGASVSEGGAANQLPGPAVRQVYTYLGNRTLTAAINRVSEANVDLLDYLDGRPGYDAGNTCPSRNCDIIRHARGIDVLDEDQDGNSDEPRMAMGDPLHARPVSVIYGGTEANPDLDDAVLFTASNDGNLHALDPVSGEELWTFIPQEMLDHLPRIYDNNATNARFYGIDGNLRSVKFDKDRDGIVEPLDGDRVYLFFGMRRGGNTVYAMDVTRKQQPILRWAKNSDDWPGLGQTWSTPTPTRIEISDKAQNADDFVLVFGGGYDSSQDNDPYSEDGSGNGIYIVDALSGNLLWRASKDNSNLNLPKMVNSIPADIRVLDLNNDGYADRFYASDTGGRVWRLDITNGNGANTLAAGGVFAELGAAGLAVPDLGNTRRFYYAPDTAVITTSAMRFMHVGIGSGYRAHPLDRDNQNAFYALRDKNTFNKLTQAQYDVLPPITPADLVDVTDDPNPNIAAGLPGWKIELRDGGWIGEKVLSESRTFADRVFFTTFTPKASDNPCLPGLGVNKLFIVNAVDGSPVTNLDGVGGDDDLTVEDRVFSLSQGGIAPEIVFLFPGDEACKGGDCDRVYGFVGVEGIGGLDLPPFVRTYWSQENTE